MTPIEFFVHGEPQPQGSMSAYARGGRVIVTSANPHLKAWRAAVAGVASGRVSAPLEGPCITDMTFYLPRPKSHYGTGRNNGRVKASAPQYHTTKPDADKLARAIGDSCTTAGIWKDDCVVVGTCYRKKYAEAGEIGVRVKILPISCAS